MVQREITGESKMNYMRAMQLELLAFFWLIPVTLSIELYGNYFLFFTFMGLFVTHLFVSIYLVNKHRNGPGTISYYFD